MMLKGKLSTERSLNIRIEGSRLKLVKELRYLGVHFTERLGINRHIALVGIKARDAFLKVASIARSTWGMPHKAVATVYTGVFLPMFTYAAGAWGGNLGKVMGRKVDSFQRVALIAVSRAY